MFGLKKWASGGNDLASKMHGAGDAADLTALGRKADNGSRISPKHPHDPHYFTIAPLPKKTQFWTPQQQGQIHQLHSELKQALHGALQSYKHLGEIDDMGTKLHGAWNNLAQTHIKNTVKQDEHNYATLSEMQKARLAAMGMQAHLGQEDQFVGGAQEAIGSWQQAAASLPAF